MQGAWQVFLKELRDALRDRRTLLMVLLSSVALGPLLLVALSVLVADFEARAEARTLYTVGLDGAPTLAAGRQLGKSARSGGESMSDLNGTPTPIGVLGGGVHLVGDSSSGKSLAQLIGSSVWGDPGVFAASWDMTKGGLEIEASSRNDTILPLDEINTAFDLMHEGKSIRTVIHF